MQALGLHGLIEKIRNTKTVKEVSADQAYTLINDESMIIIDVREQHEWEAGHLPNAIHLSKGIIEVKIEHAIPNKNTTLLLYCGGGTRSLLAGYNLHQMGYTDVISMDGGMRAWHAYDYPVNT
jgi:rhodanese-related sulfurtransferase